MLTTEQRDSLERWAMQVLPTAMAFARSLVRDPSQAEDLVQECLYRLLRKANEYDLVHDGTKLLFKSISNLCITQNSRRRELQSLNDATLAVEDHSTVSPEQEAQRAELDVAIRAALQTLPELQRAAVELRALGFNNEAIAEVLEVSPSHAGVLVFRGRKELLAQLEKAEIL